MFGKKKWSFNWPATRPPSKPFYWPLDSGGRDKLIKVISENKISTMVEVGVYCGGSARQWLAACPGLTVYGVDPYDDAEVGQYYSANKAIYEPTIDLMGMSEQEFVNQMTGPNTLYPAVLSNLWEYRARFFPVRGVAPQALTDLAKGGVKPDIVYLDAMKRGDELATVQKLWPRAVIGGNGWTWRDNEGRQPLHAAVSDYAARNNLDVKTYEGTWILSPKKRPLAGLS
jgi:hypothetical protein